MGVGMPNVIPKAVLIGMPGAGKTRIGQDVATVLNVEFRDSDVEIESRERMRIPRIFEERGEREFRAIESDVILGFLHGFDGVLSLGGGAPMTESVCNADRKSTRLNSSHIQKSRMPSSA